MFITITAQDKRIEDRVYKILTSNYPNEIGKSKKKLSIRPNNCEQTYIHFTSKKYAKVYKDIQQNVYSVCVMPKADVIRSKSRAYLAQAVIKEKEYLEGFDCIIRDTGFDNDLATNIDNFIVAASAAKKNSLTLK